MEIVVLFFARRYPPSVGGMERFAFDFSTTLEQHASIKRIVWGGSNKWLPIVLPLFFLRGFWWLLWHPNTSVIHLHDAVQAPIGWLLHVLFRKPYVIVANGLDITYENKLYQAIILPFVRRADKVIAVSRATSAQVVAHGVPAKKTTVIPLGIRDDYGSLTPNRSKLEKKLGHSLKSKVLLLTTGRLVKRKGVEWFITNVLPGIVKNNPDVLYLVVGQGSERAAIESAIMHQNLSAQVLLLGRVSDEMRELLYQSADIFVMPNIVVPGDMEGFGIVAHEAAVAGLPIVASNLEGIADALQNGKNGLLVTTGDSKAYHKELQKLISSKKERQAFGAKARKFTLETYNWDRVIDRYLKEYRDL